MPGELIKTTIILFIIFLVCFFITNKIVIAQDKCQGTIIPHEVIMGVPKGQKQKKFSVPFHHASHKNTECMLCHHTAYDTLTISSCSVKDCHFNTKVREGVESFYAAFHRVFEESDRSCIDCHKTRGKGPTSCKSCHSSH
ncbi:MAG: cytochrome c3 family protein [bacterium]